ncbi:MAG: DUF302 domain-containing protein [Bacteroidota bacterium]
MKKIVYISMFLIAGFLNAVTAQETKEDIFEKESKYRFEETIAMIQKSAKAAGWTIPVKHDIQDILMKSGETSPPATIIALCKKSIATRVMGIEDANEILALMPCRIAVYEKSDGKTYVSWANLSKANLEVNTPKSTILNDAAEELKAIADNVVKETN